MASDLEAGGGQGTDIGSAVGGAVSQGSDWLSKNIARVTELMNPSKLVEGMVDSSFQAFGNVGKSMMDFANKAQAKEYCWSCQIYSSLYDGLHKIVVGMYETLVDKTPEMITFSVIVLMIVLCFKMLKIVASPFAENISGEWVKIYTFLLRVAIIYPLFLFSSTAAGVKDNGEFSPVSDLFISGPLALGSELGSRMAQAACTIGQNSVSSLPVCQTSTGSAGSQGSGAKLSDLANGHKEGAVNILWTFHKMGVVGITGGIWTATQVPTTKDLGTIARISYVFAGIFLAMIFFMLTVTFGFRFVDALIRLMVVGALTPIFVFLWIFDGTRSIAQKALRQVLFAGTAFAVSGIIVVVSAFIIVAGFGQAFPNSGDIFSASFWSSQQTGSFDWMAYCYIVGCALVVTNLSKAIFSIAGELIESNGVTGMGEQLDNQTHRAKDMARNVGMRSVGL
ncbi:hypothetical protein GCM10019059_36210 [Camelimonas fluminis]|nr:hypothetical protein GCM10019059_36210 [Camelimonas fluminis]